MKKYYRMGIRQSVRWCFSCGQNAIKVYNIITSPTQYDVKNIIFSIVRLFRTVYREYNKRIIVKKKTPNFLRATII